MSDDEHAPAPLLQVEDLRVALPFPGGGEPVEVVRGVSFRIPEGGFHALVGESGCGKSVSAMALTRLPPASDGRVTGRVLFRGRDLLSLSPRELREARREGGVAYVFQDPMTALNPVLTLGTQLREAAPRAMPREAREDCSRKWGFRTPTGFSAPIPANCRAAWPSARAWPWPWRSARPFSSRTSRRRRWT